MFSLQWKAISLQHTDKKFPLQIYSITSKRESIWTQIVQWILNIFQHFSLDFARLFCIFLFQSVNHSVLHEYIFRVPLFLLQHTPRKHLHFHMLLLLLSLLFSFVGLKPMATWTNFLMLSKLINFTEILPHFCTLSTSLLLYRINTGLYFFLSFCSCSHRIVLDFSHIDHRMNNTKRWTKFESTLNKKARTARNIISFEFKIRDECRVERERSILNNCFAYVKVCENVWILTFSFHFLACVLFSYFWIRNVNGVHFRRFLFHFLWTCWTSFRIEFTYLFIHLVLFWANQNVNAYA